LAAAPRPLAWLSLEELTARVAEAGGQAFQARQIREWIDRHAALDYEQLRNLPRPLRERLAAMVPVTSSTVAHVDSAEDGTEKLLLRLRDGHTVELVLIPEGDRNTLCVSTQVGCPVACVFCASGLFGVERNLEAGEILEQVLHARRRLAAGHELTNLVVMGMGEPMLNLKNLLLALDRLCGEEGMGFSPRRVTVSTSGYPERIAEFAAAGRPYNLAISLHAADDLVRKTLVPTAKASVSELVAAAERYFAATGREVTFECVLLRGRNDRPEDAQALVRALAGLTCTVNLIPWNEVPEMPDLSCPTSVEADAFAARLRRGGLKVTMRRRRGADRSAACGQLRVRVLGG
jgi:23S rRNA (adenine2503-C2)-methyltransferase